MPRCGILAVGIIFLTVSGAGAAVRIADSLSSLFAGDTPSFWTLTFFAGHPPVADAIFHLEGGSLSLDTRRYRQSWAFEFEADEIKFINSHASFGFVEDEEPEIIASFDSMITKVKRPQLDGDVLTLLDAKGRPVFAAKRLRASGLENRKWYISSYFDGTSLVSIAEKFPEGLLPEITFVHGRFYGSPGCGSFFGSSYSLDGEQMSLTGLLVLRGGCPPGVWELSEAVFDALGEGRIVRRDGDRFTLTDSRGRIQIVLTPWEEREL